jgi:N12 class adenine-specific DNA methylase/adenine-specific DNA methylase
LPSKLQFYTQMADTTARQVTGSFGEWTAFLETMGRLYKYPFHEQLMIFAQKPNATACADYDLWNKQMDRYVRRGSKGIALLDTTGDNPRLKYVFDVSDTGGRENSRRLNLWEYKDEHHNSVTTDLENRFGVSGEKGLADQLEQIASKLVTEYWNDNRRDILGILADSFLEEYDDYNVEVAFRNAATVSTTYALMSRCGLNPGDYFEHEDFLSVFDFNTRDTIAVLGSAISNSSEQILRQIAVTVKNYEREASLQRQAERTQDYGEQTELHAERGLFNSESDLERDRNEASGQVRSHEEEVSAGESSGAVEQHDFVGDSVPASEGNRRGGEPEIGTDDARTDEAERRDGGTESQRPDDVDGLDEQSQAPGRGSNSRRTDSQLSEQLTLFDVGLFPTEQEQIAIINEAESVKPTPFAFSFAQNDIDDVLRRASNSEYTRMNVAAAFQKQKPMDEIVSLLKKEYHGGAGIKSDNGEFSVWYAEDGIRLAKGRTARYSRTAQIILWEAAAERIGQLMDEGKFASNVELAETELHERTELSHKLWYLRGDLSDDSRELGILSTLEDYRKGGFPDATERLAEDLKNPAIRQKIATDFSAFMEAYKEDRNVLRFRYHKPIEIWNALQDLDLPRREYTSDMAEVPKAGMFITEDEIDATLTSGSSVEGGKGRIYEYFTGAHNSKEKADFLKNEYGISGSSHAVSGQGWIESSGKGIRLQKPDCADVELNWSKVAAKFENIIRNSRYFTPEEKAKYEEMQTREWQFRKQMDAYNDIKHDHPDDVVLFQVGDFFEMYGEDAKVVSDLLDLKLTTRAVPDAEWVEMCGIPSHILEQSVKKIRENYGVTIARHNSIINEHTTYSLGVLGSEKESPQKVENEPAIVTEAPDENPITTAQTPTAMRELTQDDIDEALKKWNGDIASKRAVVRYMAEHARERDTAAWLSKEYGASDVSKYLHITVTSTDIDYEMSWTKVQRRIAQLIKEDKFFTEAEQDSFEHIDPIAIREALAERGIVNGESVDPEAPDSDPFIQQVLNDTEQISRDEQRISDEAFASEHLIPRESTYEIDGRRFVVDSVNLDFGTVSLQDVTFQNATGFPIFRSESIQFMRRLVEISEAQRVAELPAEPTVAEPKPELHNFRITDDHLGEGGAKAKFRMNMNAINLLKELEFDGRPATPEEQVILSKYVGWGGLADAFDETKDNWKNEFAELYATLSPEEYAAARSSTLNAHYTSPTVIKAIYEAVGNMGFETGNILEPSMGVGNFFGLLPEAMQNSKLYGVELDSITGRIAKQLYPKADITVAGFETIDRRDFFDLAIGNVPFGQYQVNDRAYNKLGFSIHDYFFAKALDQVRPGGVIAFVTSRYTMDKQSPEVRKYIAQRAELLGAIRLPNNAFKANAGTEVVSDIIFLQKRDRPTQIEPDWVHLGKNDDGFSINSYFIDNPEMVLGRQTSESTQYGKQDFTVEPYEDLDLGVQLKYAIQNIKGSYTEAELPDLGDGEAIDTSIPADPNVKNYSYTVVDGEVYYRENSRMVKPELNATATERVKGMVELRDCVQKLIAQQMDGYISDETIRQTQRELNTLYDNFTAKHGLINSRGNALAFADDSSYYLLCSLEVLDEDNNLKRKADMFTKRTIKPSEVVTSVDTASEALAVSIAEKACVDMEYMSSLTGKTEEELASDLRGVIYMDFNRKPDGSYTWRTADDFLSGNVREKLAYYQRALDLLPEDANHRNEIADNVAALKTAQPKDLDASEIEVRLGATWIDKSYIQQFMVETFEPPYYLRRTIEVNYSPFSAEWNITGKSQPSYSDVNAYMTYGTDRANAYKILEDTLNLRDVRIYDTVTDPDGKERRVLNSKETTLAQQKQQAIKDAFRDWIWKNPDRRQELVIKYNELFNSTRPREYDGSHIVFSGMNPEIKLREHQKNAVAHILYGGNTLLAHEVGAGKTFEMVAAAMESKRLGLCQKPLFVVPNHLTEQWASEFLRLYPSANILAATKKDFEPRNRKKFCGRIATGDYDAIIIGHSQFERIPVSQERQERLLQEQIAEIEEGLEELKASHAERFTIKSLERTKKGLETRLSKLQDNTRKDDVITFEQLGVDRLYVDEAHSFKNLFLYTKMRNVAGLSTTDAQKSSDMLLKCRYIDELTDSRGVVFATGTPVSNSMTELYTMMRYLQHDTIRNKGLAHFDCWASTFGETTTAIELAPEGTGYRARTRFAKFFNLPELMNLFKEAADIKTADQLNLPTPKAIYHNEVAQPTEIQQAMVQELSERAAAVHAGTVDPSEDNMLRITSDGRKLGLDQRIINPNLPDEPTSKVNMCVDNIHRIWKDGHDNKLTQLVFCDLSTPKSSAAKKVAKAPAGNLDSPEIRALEHLAEKDSTPEEADFTVYDDIREKLVARGIPREQIAFIHEANTEARKKELFSKVRSGQVRVLMGSTFKMGAGMNVQDRLIALHDLDAPWRPGDLEQRSGRIIRQGNMNPEVHIYRYVTEATFDAYLWQTLENKQKFISQIMTSKSPVRACDDIDETALSYAEIKALCAGDERIKEKMDLDVDVARLKLMKSNHQSQQYRLEDNLLRYFPEQIEQSKGFIAGFEADMKTLAEHPHPTDGFAGMTVRGDVLTDKENAGAALVDAFKEVKGLDPVPVGSYRGFQMSLTLEDFGRDYVLTLKGQMTHRVTLGKDPRGNLTRIDNALNGMADRLATVQSKLESLYSQMETAKQEFGKPFPQEDELRVKSARLAELNIALNIDDKTPLEAMAEETPTKNEVAKSARPSVLQKLHSYEKQSKSVTTEPKKSQEEVL